MFSAIIIIAILFLNDVIKNPPKGKLVGNKVAVAALKPDYSQEEGKETREMLAVLESSGTIYSQTMNQEQDANSEDAIKEHNTIHEAMNVSKSVLVKDKVKNSMENMQQENFRVEISTSDELRGECSHCTKDPKSTFEELAANIYKRIRILEEKVHTLMMQQQRSSMESGTMKSVTTCAADQANQANQCLAASASHQELLKITADLSKAIKDQDLQTKRLAYKVSKRIPMLYN